MPTKGSGFLCHSGLLACLTAAVVAGAASSAGAQATQTRRVVVEDFRGPAAARVRVQLLANLERQDEVEVVSRAEVRRTARSLGIRGRRYDDEEYAEIARELDVAAFIDGRTNRRRRRWAVTVRVRSGADGTILGSETWGGRTIGALSAIRRNGYARLSPYIDEVEVTPAAGGVPTPEQVAQQGSDGTPWYAAGGGGTDPELDELDDEEEDDADAPADAGRQDAFRISLVGGSLRRSMLARATVLNDCVPVVEQGVTYPNPSCRDPDQAAPDLATQQAMGPSVITEDRTYDSRGVGHMELGLEAEFYPGALGEKQEVPWLGVVGSYRHSLFLSSFGHTPDDDRIEVPTTQSELYLGARGRYRFGEEATAVEGTADIGYGLFAFELDPAALKSLQRPAVLPPVSYSYVLLGAGLSYGVVPTYLRVGFDASWRLGLGVGDQAQQVWGTQTTEVSGWGLGLNLTSEAPYIAEGAFFGLNVEYFRFSTTYRGQTGCVDPGHSGDPNECTILDPWELWPHQNYRPPDGVTPDYDNVTGGIQDPVNDTYLRLGVAFGYALR